MLVEGSGGLECGETAPEELRADHEYHWGEVVSVHLPLAVRVPREDVNHRDGPESRGEEGVVGEMALPDVSHLSRVWNGAGAHKDHGGGDDDIAAWLQAILGLIK